MKVFKGSTILLAVSTYILLVSHATVSYTSQPYGKLRFREMAIDATGFYNLQKMDLRTLYLYSRYDNKGFAKDHITLALYAISKSETPINVAGLNLTLLHKKSATLLNNERQFSIYEISSAQIGTIEKHPASKGAVYFIFSARLDAMRGVVYDIIPADKNYTPTKSIGPDGKISALKTIVESLNPSPPAKPNGMND